MVEKYYLTVDTEKTGVYNLSKIEPTNIQENQEVQTLDVNRTERKELFLIADCDDSRIYKIVMLNTTKESLQSILSAVKQISGYTEDDMIDVVKEIFQEYEEVNSEIAYF